MTDESCKRRTAPRRLGLIRAGGIVVLASACGFIVSETESALVLRFGKPVRAADKSGFYLRLPAPLERVVRVDRRHFAEAFAQILDNDSAPDRGVTL